MREKEIVVKDPSNSTYLMIGLIQHKFMEIDKEHFEAYMDRILDRLDAIEEKLDNLKGKLMIDGILLLENQDICQSLHVGKKLFNVIDPKVLSPSIIIKGLHIMTSTKYISLYETY